MDRVVDAMHAAGIKVIMGTPTYSIPVWMHRRHPEILARRANQPQTTYGMRQNMNTDDPTYRFYADASSVGRSTTIGITRPLSRGKSQ